MGGGLPWQQAVRRQQCRRRLVPAVQLPQRVPQRQPRRLPLCGIASSVSTEPGASWGMLPRAHKEGGPLLPELLNEHVSAALHWQLHRFNPIQFNATDAAGSAVRLGQEATPADRPPPAMASACEKWASAPASWHTLSATTPCSCAISGSAGQSLRGARCGGPLAKLAFWRLRTGHSPPLLGSSPRHMSCSPHSHMGTSPSFLQFRERPPRWAASECGQEAAGAVACE